MSKTEQVTIYHNPRCSKSRQTLALIEERGVAPEIVLYLDHPPSKSRLKKLLKLLGIGARDLLRTGEDAYREQDLANPALTAEQLLDAMVRNPILIERPIVVKGERAILGRPPENVLEIL